jgi:alkanesulfonate monooxygenase SsuD/methylene tetrahydromethanopterin reductase-like flavin-dependent oxidoreductase (luciferase family)
MTRESLDIMLKIWESQAPFEYRGKYWSVNKTDTMYKLLHYFLTPYQKPHLPIGVAAASYKSLTLAIAGEQGFIPMSLALNTDYVNSQWEAVTEGSQKTGRTVSRSSWRLVRDVYIAETDEEAHHKALSGMLARVWRDYLIPLFKELTFLPSMKHAPEIPDEAVTPEYMADHLWLVGSPETVASKIRKLYNEVGSFACLLVLVYDHWQDQQGWEQSTRLLAEEVMPRLADLTGV